MKYSVLGKEATKGISDKVIMRDVAEEIYRAARILKDKANVEKLADAVIKIGNAEIIYYFAVAVEGAPIAKLAQAVIDSNDKEYIERFAHYVKGAPVITLMDKYNQLNGEEYSANDDDIENE